MNAHESIRAMLALAAAGALGHQDQREVEEHARVCETCRVELESWTFYTAGLSRLPQPAAPPNLIGRTQARILRERELAAARRWNGLTLGTLGAFSWVVSIIFWIMARTITGGMFEVFGRNLVSAGPWFAVTSIVASVTAGVAALLLRNRREIERYS
jgi:hypothetical protein